MGLIRLSVIVPFHRGTLQLGRSLAALRAAAGHLPAGTTLADLTVAADAARDDPTEVARRADASVVPLANQSGPAAARNRAAAVASGNILVFVDADVVVHEDALGRLAALFAADSGLAAAFGAYDEAPEAPGFFSQCRNLSHAFVHLRGRGPARTFWAGLGAARADAFAAVGGFDSRFARPCVEDIDLGYRLTGAGYRILLEPSIQGTHLKQWTLWSSVVSDVRDRGVPWTQLLNRNGAMHDDLNISRRYRASVVAAFLFVGCLGGAIFWPFLALPAAGLLLGLWSLNRTYYRFFVSRRGWWFTLRWFPFHVFHHLCNGLSFIVGTVLYRLRLWTGLALPGALPAEAWRPSRLKSNAASGPRGVSVPPASAAAMATTDPRRGK